VSTIGNLLPTLQTRLAPHTQTPLLDSQVLLAHTLGVARAWVIAHPEVELSQSQMHNLEFALARLERGEPLPYVTGTRDFYGLTFKITPDVLVPRPETELLVDKALEWLRAHPGRRLAADIGTGSGCIAVSLAYHLPDLVVIASDLSLAALRVAHQNITSYALESRVHCLAAHLLPRLRARYDLICANLPYIPASLLETLEVYRREPLLALDGGSDGLTLIRALLAEASRGLAPGGRLLLEIEASQGESALRLACSHFPGAQVTLLQDLAGLDRLIVIDA
jgi:release factor glutamine methyltransferase